MRPRAPATIGTGVDLWPAAPVTITAPWPAVLEAATADTVILTGTAGAVEVRKCVLDRLGIAERRGGDGLGLAFETGGAL